MPPQEREGEFRLSVPGAGGRTLLEGLSPFRTTTLGGVDDGAVLVDEPVDPPLDEVVPRGRGEGRRGRPLSSLEGVEGRLVEFGLVYFGLCGRAAGLGPRLLFLGRGALEGRGAVGLVHLERVGPRPAVLVQVALGLEGEPAGATRVGPLVGVSPDMLLEDRGLGAGQFAVRAEVPGGPRGSRPQLPFGLTLVFRNREQGSFRLPVRCRRLFQSGHFLELLVQIFVGVAFSFEGLRLTLQSVLLMSRL